MKFLKPGIPLAAIALLALTGCHDDNPWASVAGEGRVAPKIKMDPSVRDVYPTRADDGLIVPAVEDLKITLSRTDGTYSNSWESINVFPTEQAFKVGAHTLEASFGELEAEGFERPYFYGSTEFSVREEEEAQPEVTAKLANTMVSIDYTDDFKNYFASYATQLHSKGGDFITFIPGETRPAYLMPGEATVTLQITKQNGVSATLEPASIATKPQHHYHLTLDVNGGETGDMQLVVNFDDSLVQDNVVIDLSDDLLLSPEPVVNAKGFTPDQALNIIEGSRPDQPTQFMITALGGIQSATLTTRSTALRALGFPAEIDLVAATESQRDLLKTLGVDVKGLWRNPDKMASVDLSGALAKIKGAGTHEFSLVVKDKMTKVNLPVTMVVTTEPVELEIVSAPSITLDATEATMLLSYSGKDLKNNVKIEALDRWGNPQSCEIISVSAATRAAETYNVRFKVPETDADLKVKVKYNGEVKDSGTIARRGIVLSAAPADIWATHVTLGVKKSKETPLSDVKIYSATSDGSFVEVTNLTRNESAGTITVKGLSAGSKYTFKGSDTGAYESDYTPLAVTTESPLQPQNGNMDTWGHDTGWSNKIMNIGNQTIYNYFPGTADNAYWATRNALTTCKDFGRSSCFYNNYSGTYGVTNGSGSAAEICSVGYGKDGTNTYTALGGSCNNVSAGMLFMGTYSYDYSSNKETINLGRPFTSRPTSVSFDYKYAPQGSESFRALVVIENRDGGKTTELARGVFESNSSVTNYTAHTIKLNYTNKSLKATHAYVYFLSSTADSPGHHTVKGSQSAFAGYSDYRYTGSVLNIDNIVFNY